MSKTPFEIRADLLKLAQEHVESQYKANVDFATQTFTLLVKEGKEVQENFAKFLPEVFTFEDVMTKAREMAEFVNGKASK